MGKHVDLTNRKFGRLTVVGRAENKILATGVSVVMWLCKCDCGNENLIKVRTPNLNNENTKSCGCSRKESVYRVHKKYNTYDLTGEYGIGYTFKDELFYFDLEDYEKIKNHCWCYGKKDYIYTTIDGKLMQMHRMIMDAPEGWIIDHIFHKGYDNRKKELRLATKSQNAMNMITPSNNTSGTKGVTWSSSCSKWMAEIEVRGNKFRKYFKIKDEAIAYRKYLEKTYFKDYNFKQDLRKSEF